MAGVKGDNGCLFMFGKAAQDVNVEAIAMSPLKDLKVARPVDMQPVSPDQALLLKHVLESRGIDLDMVTAVRQYWSQKTRHWQPFRGIRSLLRSALAHLHSHIRTWGGLLPAAQSLEEETDP
eukprot:TRINITY_DN1842_c0_g1_i3.p3 TRINITY_DN1842_c0_g1~~TRINITY_DN1842_c0_g1_i3.p3  ORF type:complete len:122 (-),score=33.96 TRINITY_DN1842_c0_g1_i3:400-765(-)